MLAHSCTHPLRYHILVMRTIVTYVMSVSYGKLEEFDTANGEDWVKYIECYDGPQWHSNQQVDGCTASW